MESSSRQVAEFGYHRRVEIVSQNPVDQGFLSREGCLKKCPFDKAVNGGGADRGFFCQVVLINPSQNSAYDLSVDARGFQVNVRPDYEAAFRVKRTVEGWRRC